jgi:biotin carboxyl carrier protein
LSEQPVKSEITGTVWRILAKVGDKVAEEDQIMILESMKMEIPVLAPDAGTIKEILVREGEAVSEGQAVAVLA